MRIALTGDLHLPITDARTLQQFAAHLAEENPDVLGLLGDIGEGAQYFSQCLKIFRDALPKTPILVVPGNHDLWVHNRGETTPELLHTILPAIAAQYDMVWLETDNSISGEIAFVGSYLHYDYSAKDRVGPASRLPDEWFAANKNSIINDRYMEGQPDDKTFARELGNAFRGRLLRAHDDPQVKKIVILTHVPCIEEQITRRPQDYQWSVATPYFGNLSHCRFIGSLPKVSHIISAHSHRANHCDSADRGCDNAMSEYELYQHLRDTNDGGHTGRPWPVATWTLGADYRKPTHITLEI